MNIKVYSPQSSTPTNSVGLLIKHSEILLLGFVALIGLLGSVYVLSANPGFPKNELSQFTPLSIEKQRKSEFDKYVKISGNKNTESKIQFEIIHLDINAKRYVMEMGDGRRMILTQPTFEYQYSTKGEYLLELKELQRGLIVVVGDKKLKIK